MEKCVLGAYGQEVVYHIYPKYKGNSVDLDQMPQNAGLHCLPCTHLYLDASVGSKNGLIQILGQAL